MVHSGLVGDGIEKDANSVMVVMVEEMVVFWCDLRENNKRRDKEMKRKKRKERVGYVLAIAVKK